MKLIDPSTKFARTFEEGIAEFASDHIPGFLNNGKPLTDVASYVEHTQQQARGERLQEGWVPSSTFWLMDGETFVALVNIRHRLTPYLEQRGGHIGYAVRPSKQKQGYGTELLRLSLHQAKQLGIHRALVTCDKHNIGSRKVIEKNGGVLQDEIEVDGEAILRFWVES